MKLTILSDIHQDINKDYDFSILKEQEFVIIAGDICGNPIFVKQFIMDNITKGICIEGNHLGYSKSGQYQIDFRQGAIRWLRHQFMDTKVKFLENDIYIQDNIVFVGCTLWTDFCLYGEKVQVAAMKAAQCGMNDYYLIKCGHEEDIVNLFPQKTLEWHKQSVTYIEDICQKYPDKKIVVISHHAPSNQSISPQYRSSDLNPAYASNLEWIIEKHTNIKLWVHGHNHGDSNYKIKQCQVICHPFGYYNECNRDMTKFGQDADCLGHVIDTEDL